MKPGTSWFQSPLNAAPGYATNVMLLMMVAKIERPMAQCGFELLLPVGPELYPHAAIVFQIMFPAPQFFSIRRPKRFRTGLAAAGVSDFMLFRAGLVKIRFRSIEQITSAGGDAGAPL